jgi:type I restriction enzyme R subunit
MRSYQIAATERILWKINSAYQGKNRSKTESGGYIWHTTGSGKTHGEIKAIFIAFSGISEIAAICPVRNHEYL